VLINLYGFLEDDFVGRLIIVDDGQPVAALVTQLQAWGPDLYPTAIRDPYVTNEQGAVLDTTSTILDSGLSPGALFRVGSSGP
jgi:hypothetical protein